MKRKRNTNYKTIINKITKKNTYLNSSDNHSSLKYNFFNKYNNRNKISLILNFLDINEQLPLIKVNSIFSKILINKYNLPFKSITLLRQIKNNRSVIESKYSNLYTNFKNILDNNDIEQEEYQYIISYLLKNVNNNFIIFDKINDNNKIISNEEKNSNVSDNKNNSLAPNDLIIKKYNIFFEFLFIIKYIKDITRIKISISNIDNEIDKNYLKNEIIDKYKLVNFFQNIKHIEIDKIENSFYFINTLFSYENNSIKKVEKINLNNINIKKSNETILNYDNYNSLIIPNSLNIKYLFLNKVNLSLFCLNEIINKNVNLVKLVINSCSNNNLSLYDEKEYNILIGKSINNCKELNYIEFNNNKFSIYLTNKIIHNLILSFFNLNNKIKLISCGYYSNNNGNNETNDTNEDIIEIPCCLKDCTKLIYSNNFNKYLTIKFSPSFIYHVKKSKRIIEVTNYLNKDKEKIINELKYEKIKLTLYSSDNFSISNNIKKIMQKYYQKDITKYLQIFICFENAELTPILSKNKTEIYPNIEKLTIFFQGEDEAANLFGNKIISALMAFFPCIKTISFKNINFQSDSHKFREDFDKVIEMFQFMLFGQKNEDLKLFQNKKCCLKEIKFYNCYFSHNLITKDILDDFENNIYTYLGKKVVKITLSD